MNRRVVLSRRAEEQLEKAYRWYAERSQRSAAKWYNGFIDALESLAVNPKHFGQAPESSLFPVQLRQLLYGRRRNWRRLYTVRDDMVFVVSIRHAAQGEMTPDDL